jgi:outer membrane protein
MSKQMTESGRQETEDRRWMTEGEFSIADCRLPISIRTHIKSKISHRGHCVENRQSKICFSFFVLCFLSSILCLLSGCDLFSKADPYALKIDPERFRKVETLELKEAKAQKQVRPDVNDVNEAPPKELELSLEQCRAMTLENNLELKVQLISPAIAAERVSEEEARFEAAFSSNVNFVKTDTPTASFLDEISGSQTEYLGTDLGVQVPLRTGGTVNFNMADSRIKTGSIYSVFDPSYSSDMSLSISQPLLRNAGRRTSTYGIRIAEYERQITDARTKLEVIRVLAAADRV